MTPVDAEPRRLPAWMYRAVHHPRAGLTNARSAASHEAQRARPDSALCSNAGRPAVCRLRLPAAASRACRGPGDFCLPQGSTLCPRESAIPAAFVTPELPQVCCPLR